MSVFKKSRFLVEIPVENKGERLSALYQTMTEAFILIPEKDWSYILMATADDEIMDILCEQGILVKEGVDEAALFENWRQQHVHDFSTIRSKVLVTRKCNNRCRYCIIDPEEGEMSPETAMAMDRFYVEVITEKNPRRVEDDYLGGEPLLSPAIILESAGRRFYFCLGRGIEYSFSMTTNGTLLKPSIISAMKDVGLSHIRVSMAGPGQVHDFLRPSKNNGKTYEVIMKNLEMVSHMIPINIECQYDSESQDFKRIPEMMDDFCKRNIDIQEIFFTPILPQRQKKTFDSGMGDPEVLTFLMEEAGKRGYPQEKEAPSNACIADFRARFVFDTDGSIVPCPSLQGGEMAYGHVTKGIDFIAESQMRKRPLADRCLNQCSILPICMGGCRNQALIHNNDFNGIDCHYDVHRYFLEQYIRQRALEVCSQDEPCRQKEAA